MATLSQCAITFEDVTLTQVELPAYLQDLATGPSRTVMQALRRSGPERRLTVVFAKDTQMETPFDAEAFGRANTRRRPWLQDSVWLSSIIKDEGIALAHELFHVLANSGEHVSEPGNLMHAMTQGDNTKLTASQCKQARDNGQHTTGWPGWRFSDECGQWPGSNGKPQRFSMQELGRFVWSTDQAIS